MDSNRHKQILLYTYRKMSNKRFVPPKPQFGASQLAAIVGMNRFCSREELKTQLEEGYEREDNARTIDGTKHELVALRHYARYVHKKEGLSVKPGLFRRCRTIPRLVGIADGLVESDEHQSGSDEHQSGSDEHQSRSKGGVEIKCRYQDHCAEAGQVVKPFDSIPDYYLPQLVAYMLVYGRKWWDLASVCLQPVENGDGRMRVSEMTVHRVYWRDVKDIWWDSWRDQVNDFIASVTWCRSI